MRESEDAGSWLSLAAIAIAVMFVLGLPGFIFLVDVVLRPEPARGVSHQREVWHRECLINNPTEVDECRAASYEAWPLEGSP